MASSFPQTLRRVLGRIRTRLLLVNLFVLLVPVAGLEFARIYERQLLDSLERDMENQATLVRTLLETDLTRNIAPGTPQHIEILTKAARTTRTRIRLIDAQGAVIADSHENGPPEGPEPPPPSMMPESASRLRGLDAWASGVRSLGEDPRERWPDLPDRYEIRQALLGNRATRTRVRERKPGVFLFLADPVRKAGEVIGAVYVVRSTQPVLVELYKIRTGLFRVLGVAVCITALITVALAWSISRPLEKLSKAAKRIAAGERDVIVPVEGSGEIRDLSEAFSAMKERLDARLRYISDFAADVAHEFKSPLTSIRGAAELLEEGAADDPEARRRFLQNIELDVSRLDRLVSRLLELSRIEASSEAPVLMDLEAMAERVVSRHHDLEQPVRLDYRLGTRFVRARETDLETALMNLVDNALRYSPVGETVWVRVESGKDERGQEVARIRVEDRGPGIPAEHLPKIFERFFTTDREKDGTGLGLSIVQSVAEAHGGRVRVESEAGKGAVFEIEIPVRQEGEA